MFEVKNYPKLNEKIYYKMLANGLKVYYLQDPYSVIFEARLIVNFGAYNLQYADLEIIPGTAHFLEHMMFKMESDDALNAFSKLGAEANAATSYKNTIYMFDTANNFFETLNLLFEMLDNPIFKSNEIEKERAIIIEEINMYQADINEEIDNILSRNTYYHHPFKYDIGGTIEDVNRINKKLLLDTYNLTYSNSNRILVLGGNIDVNELEDFLKEYDLKTCYVLPPASSSQDEPADVVKKYQEISRDVDLDIALLKIKLPPTNRTIKDEFCANMALSMLLGKTSIYYEELLEAGLIGSNFRYYENIECNAFEITIENSCQDISLYLSKLTDIMFNTSDDFFTNENFNRYKKAFLGRFIFSLNTLKSRVRLFHEYIVEGHILYDILDLVKEITLNDVISMYDEIKNSPYTLLRVNSTKK